MRILFTCLPLPGHWHPLIPLARAAQDAGHSVAFATDLATGSQLEALGFRVYRAGFDRGEMMHARQLSQSQRSHTDLAAESLIPDLLRVGQQWQPSLIVRDGASLGACLVAELLDIPHVSVEVFFGLSAGAVDTRAADMAGWVNRLRETWGLCRLSSSEFDTRMRHRFLSLSGAPYSLRYPGTAVPATLHAVRPFLFDQSGPEGLPAWVGTLPRIPTVLVTMGTLANQSRRIFGTIIEALHDERVNLILTVGRDQDPSQFHPLPENVHVESYIPQSLLMPCCDLMLAHGGHSTLLTALSYGVPQLLMPGTLDARVDMSQRCVELGVALVLEGEQVSKEAVRDGVREMLSNASYRERAAQIVQEIEALPSHQWAVGLLDRLATDREPIMACNQ